MTRYYRLVCLKVTDAAKPLMLWLLQNVTWSVVLPPASILTFPSVNHAIRTSIHQYVANMFPWWLFLGVFTEWKEEKPDRHVVQHCGDAEESNRGKGQECERHVTGVRVTCKVPDPLQNKPLCFHTSFHYTCCPSHMQLLIRNQLRWTSMCLHVITERFPLAESRTCSRRSCWQHHSDAWWGCFALAARLQWQLMAASSEPPLLIKADRRQANVTKRVIIQSRNVP